ncbi:anaerobic glycerol-3-phosphate dehydrogenase subunit C [Desulfovibrio sp. OttesenSCG-928-I05]|nr:anaerobic glycerol-3-phosphate dehydrogenase subunit C [Desulfovibrio sp. OttesenSCG-928-I05]
MKASSMHNPDACTACTICVAHCPVAEATLKFRGPKFTGPAYERFRLLGFGDEASLEYCSNCKNCDISCPSGVPVSTFNMLARAEYCKTHPQPLRDWILGHAGLMGTMTGPFPAWMINLGMNNPLTRLVMDAMGIDKRAPLPSFAPRQERKALHARSALPKADKVAAFFPGCFINYYEPQVGLDVIRLLEMAGYAVVVPENFTCCGLPLVAGGFADDALDYARTNSMELARWARAGIPVITACPSCALMLSREYADLFPAEEGLGRFGSSVHEACAFFLSLIEKGELSLRNARAAATPMSYHAPCHLRALGQGRTGLDLLRLVPGVQVIDTDEKCCGISGSYGFKKGKYDIGMAVGSPLFRAMKESNAPLSLSECGTCRVQMRHGSGIPSRHPLSVLVSLLG